MKHVLRGKEDTAGYFMPHILYEGIRQFDLTVANFEYWGIIWLESVGSDGRSLEPLWDCNIN